MMHLAVCETHDLSASPKIARNDLVHMNPSLISICHSTNINGKDKAEPFTSLLSETSREEVWPLEGAGCTEI